MTGSPVWHPFWQHGLGLPIPKVARGEGAALILEDGSRVIDAISSWWVTTHGHNNPRIMAAIRAQTERLDQVIFAGWTHQPAEDVARGLVAMLPEALTRVFFSDSGSTCVEVALKMALGFWANRGEARHRILVMEHSYHGDTIGTMSVGERGVYNAAYAPLLFDVGTIPFPIGDGANTIEALEAACRENPAALIVEPLVLGAGGMLFYPPAVLAAMAEVCRRHGVLFIADEVMTGFGRTGTMLACNQAGVVPDILCLAKGLTGGSMPLAVTVAQEPIFAAHWSTDRAKLFYHSSSYTANPIACAAAVENLAMWREEPVQARIDALGQNQQALLDRLAALPGAQHPRRCGTIIAVDFATPDGGYLSALAPHLMAFARDHGVLLRPLGNTVYVLPPYCISAADLARVGDVVEEGLAALPRPERPI
ncbi:MULTISPECIES: adenosylmethionine--8-amino-7-oxononanoate transaminase [unclassified Novosphingobium]|uniref:adenosylmethionine--8-amino-7-oxononanoate transaminase n=1 Tax=unclassified Novosphingobium TaxID=2644732 RepID=UPI001440E811|nr:MULTISPECIES: adenosylmethionine--8-amino-7-oxononanoate transaminase [unclassified Novosphingobium]MBB3358849.1 adenosylmethionine-8-amino-7-oxononanoate aminotransferase [Novosphingobium sp. BK256]MBB3375670.1 adenosylmethionine-8-amino-7-oxononanoate aminotransferase [Novosphingobium sp. BK280]MBB3379621.1 adenosylmethionine-8-amino-7-oxononanoate aminotransferase [Novosphingobium sp. BK258]MBB3421316.1 adenosylmethionine-8-amino-7-oxononanoate aminotransferase [Novosphingobium sp. BK267]